MLLLVFQNLRKITMGSACSFVLVSSSVAGSRANSNTVARALHTTGTTEGGIRIANKACFGAGIFNALFISNR
jgi:hypothetical protein